MRTTITAPLIGIVLAVSLSPVLAHEPQRNDDWSAPTSIEEMMDRMREMMRHFDFADGAPNSASNTMSTQRHRVGWQRSDDGYRAVFALEGFDKGDISVTTNDMFVVIRAESEGRQGRRAFLYSLSLPEDADPNAVTAAFTNGQLVITAPTHTVRLPDGIRDIQIM